MSAITPKEKLSHQGTILKDRFTTEDVFERIIQVADEEVDTRAKELFFSALAAGFAITLTFFLYASMYGSTQGHPILKALLYPLGFVYIVLGGYQLFTENTLPPVALALERMTTIPSVLRVWVLVLFGNLFGAGLGAIALAFTGVFTPEAAQAAVTLANSVLATPFMDLFWKGVFAGFIVAGVVWIDYSSQDTITRFFMTYIAFMAIPLTGLKHVVITVAEMTYLWLSQGVFILHSLVHAVLPILLGNIAGGVFLVTIVNYFQTASYIEKNPSRRIPLKEWLFSFKR